MKRWMAIGIAAAGMAATACADRGSIPFRPAAKVFEPNQRAMIAWNGQEEILLLSTDLRASEPTKVLEVLPLPSEPQVKKGDVEVFRKATALINSRVPKQGSARGGRAPKFGALEGPAGEVTFHEKIGAHDVSVTRVLDGGGFVEWVNNYLRKAGVDSPHIPSAMREVIQEYLGDGYDWFVFDVVELDEKPKTNDAIQYRFKSDRLYYPLRITRVEEGQTSVDLLVLTPRLLSKFPGLPVERINLPHQPISITRDELHGLNEDMDALLGHQPDMKLRIWNVRGNLSEFTHDLIAQ